jgi:hypothetical protein
MKMQPVQHSKVHSLKQTKKHVLHYMTTIIA